MEIRRRRVLPRKPYPEWRRARGLVPPSLDQLEGFDETVRG